jgi:hypothetical protein
LRTQKQLFSVWKAKLKESGNYSCAVPHYRKTSISVFIFDGGFHA